MLAGGQQLAGWNVLFFREELALAYRSKDTLDFAA